MGSHTAGPPLARAQPPWHSLRPGVAITCWHQAQPSRPPASSTFSLVKPLSPWEELGSARCGPQGEGHLQQRTPRPSTTGWAPGSLDLGPCVGVHAPGGWPGLVTNSTWVFGDDDDCRASSRADQGPPGTWAALDSGEQQGLGAELGCALLGHVPVTPAPRGTVAGSLRATEVTTREGAGAGHGTKLGVGDTGSQGASGCGFPGQLPLQPEHTRSPMPSPQVPSPAALWPGGPVAGVGRALGKCVLRTIRAVGLSQGLSVTWRWPRNLHRQK